MRNGKGDGRDRRVVNSQDRQKGDNAAAVEVGARIRQLRSEKLKMTQHMLASELGVSHGTVSYWERGGNATPANLRRFAKLSGVSMEWLTNGIDAQAFHPRWTELEHRMLHIPDGELEDLFDWFDDLLDRRERMIGQKERKGRGQGGGRN